MSIKEISEKALRDIFTDCMGDRYGNVIDNGNGASVIDRAIREAAAPLVGVLEQIADTGVPYEKQIRKMIADWKVDK